MKNYESFLNMITQDKLLKSSQVFYDFISTSKETEFQLKMKAYDKVKLPQSISQIKFINGEIQIDTDIINNISFWNKTLENIQSNCNLLKKLYQTYKLLFNEINQISIRFHELSILYNEIVTLYSKRNSFFDHNNDNEKQLSIKTYTNIQKFMNNFSYFYKKQSLIVDLDMNQHIKYLITEYNVFKELKDDYINYKSNCDKTEEKLNKKKDDLFKRKEIKKWELKAEDTHIDPYNKDQAYGKMLPDETHKLNELKQYCDYLGSSFVFELKRIERLIQIQNNTMLNELYDKTKGVLEELINFLETPGN